jgi:hypothetical protein
LIQKVLIPENSSNLTTNKYQCGAQFFEKDFHVTNNNSVPMKLVGNYLRR